MLRCLCALALIWPLVLGPLAAQDLSDTPLQDVLQSVQTEVANPSRGTVPAVLRALLAADAPGTVDFLRAWSDREVYERPTDGFFFYA
ncbi:MAG: urea ABC transporter permease subunit UrtB, partial [Loktanella sp.]|nr:urea ABC transporter permease subunit UrtB [Loktanella sp.]